MEQIKWAAFWDELQKLASVVSPFAQALNAAAGTAIHKAAPKAVERAGGSLLGVFGKKTLPNPPLSGLVNRANRAVANRSSSLGDLVGRQQRSMLARAA